MVKESIVICISGMAGSGKSTAAKRLAEKYKLRYYSGGDALKSIALGKGYKPLIHGWWESREGKRFLEERSSDPKFDKAIDKKLVEAAQRGNVVLDSRTMPWLLKDGFKIWIDASSEKRAERIARRNGISVKDAARALKSKEEKTKAIYKKLYGFDLGQDFKPFNLVLNTDSLDEKEVFHVLCVLMEKTILKPCQRC